MRTYSLWGNGGGDDVLVIDDVTPLEAANEMDAQGLRNHNGWNYFLVRASRTDRCRARGYVTKSDIARATVRGAFKSKRRG